MGAQGAVVFLDSGIGGLPYVQWVAERLPDENYVYVADTENFPYGKKAPSILKNVVVQLAGRIIEAFDPKLIVIACNTASVAALDELRRRFTCHFVGVVPAVKPAARRSYRGKIGLLATYGTVVDRYTEALIEEFASECTVVSIGDNGIVDFVERKFLSSTLIEREQALSDSVGKLKSAGIDSLVIGCTHFVYLEDDLLRAFGPGVNIVDSREGVGRQAIKMVERAGLNPYKTGERTLFITSTGSCHERYRKFARRFGFVFRGQLRCAKCDGSVRNQ